MSYERATAQEVTYPDQQLRMGPASTVPQGRTHLQETEVSVTELLDAPGGRVYTFPLGLYGGGSCSNQPAEKTSRLSRWELPASEDTGPPDVETRTGRRVEVTVCQEVRGRVPPCEREDQKGISRVTSVGGPSMNEL